MTVFQLPRLSVDIDLDFVPNLSREDIKEARERISDILKKYMLGQDYFLSDASRFSLTLDALHFNYINSAGNRDMIKIEVNYSLRTHILPMESRFLQTDAFGDAISVGTVATMEIFAAKTNALINRAAARDLYDFYNMVEKNLFSDDEELYRKCVISYATISSKKVNMTFDTSSIDSLTFRKIKAELFPVLVVREQFDLDGMKQMAKEYIASVMKPTQSEIEYMERFVSGEYKPELLFENADILNRIRNHPMALWKCK